MQIIKTILGIFLIIVSLSIILKLPLATSLIDALESIFAFAIAFFLGYSLLKKPRKH